MSKPVLALNKWYILQTRFPECKYKVPLYNGRKKNYLKFSSDQSIVLKMLLNLIDHHKHQHSYTLVVYLEMNEVSSLNLRQDKMLLFFILRGSPYCLAFLQCGVSSPPLGSASGFLSSFFFCLVFSIIWLAGDPGRRLNGCPTPALGVSLGLA